MFTSSSYHLILSFFAVLALASPTPRKITIALPHQSAFYKRDASDLQVGFDNLTQALEYFNGRYDSIPDNENKVESTVATARRGTSESPESMESDSKLDRRAGTGTAFQKLGVLQIVEASPEGIYYAKVAIKDQPQPFPMIVDTGSASLLVPGIKCGPDQGCRGNLRYANTGKDQHESVQIMYGGGSTIVEGDYFTDDVTMEGLVAEQMDVLSMSTGTNLLPASTILGVLGFGFAGQRLNQHSSDISKPGFFQTLVAQNKVEKPVFSLYLGRSVSKSQTSSSITLGGVTEASYHGPVTTRPVLGSNHQWEIELEGATVNHVMAGPKSKGTVIIDTASAYSYMSHAAAYSIFEMIPKAFPLSLDLPPHIPQKQIYYALPCNPDPEVALVFGAKEFKIDLLDLMTDQLQNDGKTYDKEGRISGVFIDLASNAADNIKPLAGIAQDADTKYCLASIISEDPTTPGDTKPFVLGQNFLKSWYSIFTMDPNRPTIGFAAAVGNNPSVAKDVAQSSFPGFPSLPGAGLSPQPLRATRVWQDPELDLTTDEVLDMDTF